MEAHPNTIANLAGLGIGHRRSNPAPAGVWRNHAFFGIGLFVFFLLLRSLFLVTLENPGPGYTLERYPAVTVLASGFFRSR